MKIKGKIIKEEYIHFQRLAAKLPVFDGCLVIYTLYSLIAIVIYIYLIIYFYSFDIEGIPSYIAIIFVFSFFSIYQYYIIPKKWEKEYKNFKAIHIPIEVEINENEITIRNELLNYQQAWSNYAKWMEDNEIILLFEKNDKVLFIPKRILNDEEKNYIHSIIGKNNIPLRKPRVGPQVKLLLLMVIIAILIAYIIYSNIYFN
jgi:hypothetical protein